MNVIPDSKIETLRQAFLAGESVRGAMHQEAGAWAYDPDNPSTDPLGDWERAAASIAYQQRLAGRVEERDKLAAKANISR